MKYLIRHSCGHFQEHKILGSWLVRAGNVNWLEQTICNECFKQETKDRKERETGK